ncbi:rod shape-determining protein MreD [Altererythrobacter sp. B11]|uniref:rod shape-determining protein MreD n=1 Tax=Altererythrobacter sp. B11 TaxID=2060312 RepID=UPI000DC70B51|nr:rod shape-determining protein MreD [Altererythrobacter sp. B11]BBC73158.1 rod shape-determining protein MreD [Altererythrobacter sp. B11]
MERLNPNARRDAFGSKINRTHSTLLAYGLPWLTILAGSLTPFLPVLSPAPIIPPLGFIIMLAWRLLRPGLLPLWAGLPLGLFDDLFSGQPLGSGILLFSLALIAIDLVEIRFPWRSFWLDWLTASAAIVIYLAVSALLSGASLTFVQLTVILPQLLLSVVLFPIVARMVSLLDRVRLMRVRRLG